MLDFELETVIVRMVLWLILPPDKVVLAFDIGNKDSGELPFYALGGWDHPPLKLLNRKDRGSGYFRGILQRSLRIGSFLADGDVL